MSEISVFSSIQFNFSSFSGCIDSCFNFSSFSGCIDSSKSHLLKVPHWGGGGQGVGKRGGGRMWLDDDDLVQVGGGSWMRVIWSR